MVGIREVTLHHYDSMSLEMIQRAKFAHVTPTQKLVLWALADCHNGETGQCNPSVAYLVEVTGYTARAVGLAIAALEDAKQLSITRVAGGRSSYELTPHGERNPRTTFTPERRSVANHVRHHPRTTFLPTPERRSPHPRTTFARTRKNQKLNRKLNR